MVISELEIGINLVGIDEAIEKMKVLNAEIEKNIIKSPGLPVNVLYPRINFIVDGLGETISEKIKEVMGKANINHRG